MSGMDKTGITVRLGPDGREADVLCFEALPSTNLKLKEMLLSGDAERETLVTAREQTAGRGRLGRSFFSPGGGLYMSFCLRERDAEAAAGYTPVAAAAVCLVLEEMTGKPFLIKWVNDIYLNGKKVCGILCERVKDWVICGIGINLTEPAGGFPESAGNAGAAGVDADRGELAKKILQRMVFLLSMPEKAFEVYEKRMFLTGMKVFHNGEPLTVKGIGRDWRLLAERENGETVALMSGEVTLHGQV